MTIASAAHAAVSALPAFAASPSSSERESSSSAFASQLNGLTADAGAADAGAWRSAAPAGGTLPSKPEPVSSFPSSGTGFNPQEALSRQMSLAIFNPPRPQLTAAAGMPKPVPGQSSTAKDHRRPAVATESTQTAVVALAPALPTPEFAATAAEATEDSALDDDPQIAGKSAAPLSAQADAADPAPPLVTATGGQAQQAQPAQEMAFAAKVQPIPGAEHAALPAEMASSAAMASANRKVVAAAADENPSSAEPPALLAANATAVEQSNTPTATAASPAPAAPAPAHHAEAPASPAENAAKPSGPLKDISMQVTQPGKERVDVRVVQQGGEVHISVHSADSGVTSGLRQGLSELQSKLEESGYRSEMWRPGNSAAPVTAAPAAQASNNHSRGGDGHPQQGGPQQESGRRNPNQSNQPRWVEEMESSLGGGEKSSGGFYGFGS